jgi:hypothetical protein
MFLIRYELFYVLLFKMVNKTFFPNSDEFLYHVWLQYYIWILVNTPYLSFLGILDCLERSSLGYR